MKATGIIPGVPFEQYRAIQGVSWSDLSHMRRSALAYREHMLNPKPPTATMALGSAMHAAVLEPDLFAATYAVYDGRRGTNAYAEWQAEHPGMVDLKPDEMEQCEGVAAAIHSGIQGKHARRILRVCRAEVSVRWVDPWTRIRCKARPDLVGPRVLADLKTTTSVDEHKFGRLSGEMGYPGKMAFALMGLEAVGVKVDDVYIIAVEQTPPHDVGVFRIDDTDMERARTEAERLLRMLKECRKLRRWPGRFLNVELLDLPPWTFEDDSYDISDVGLVLAPKGV